MRIDKYTREDTEAMGRMWFPKPGTPFKYEVRKSVYNYEAKRWDFEIYKQIECSYAEQMTTQSGLTENEAQAMLDYAIQSGNVELYCAEKLAAQRVIWDAKAKQERAAKQAQSEAYWAERKKLLDAVVAECDEEMERRKRESFEAAGRG